MTGRRSCEETEETAHEAHQPIQAAELGRGGGGGVTIWMQPLDRQTAWPMDPSITATDPTPFYG